jgi:ubiquinone/menaquinone biosynthesis C-methylase UbiE
MPLQDQHRTVISVFTRRADAYTVTKPVLDAVSYGHMRDLAQPQPGERVLDIATGPGRLALELGEYTGYIVGVDITLALLEKAETERQAKGRENIRFHVANVESLPFPDQTFDLVTCHKAFHHFSAPQAVLAEVRRVLKGDGRFVLGDTISSEDPMKSALHNRIEVLRDPSHVRMYPVSQMVAMVAAAGLEPSRLVTWTDEGDVDDWIAMMNPGPETAADIRRLLIQSLEGDTTGMGVHWEGGRLYRQRVQVVLLARKR